MSSDFFSKLLFWFVIYSMFVDLRFTKNMKRDKLYNNFELHAGSYADISTLAVVGLLAMEFFKINVSPSLVEIVLRVILALLYCGMFKVILQKIIRSKYYWIDTKQEEKDLKKVNRKRATLLISYLLLLLFFRNLTLTIDDGVKGNAIAIVGVLWFSRSASRKCSKIKNKISSGEAKDQSANSRECNYNGYER